MDIFKLFSNNKIDYSKYVLLCKDIYQAQHYDISVIIPVRGRTQFYDTINRFLYSSIHNSGLKVSITYVEHSVTPEYFDFNTCGYIHIPAIPGEEFNKCLCFNIGFLYGPKADKYLFYDSDLICSDTFFNSLDSFKRKDAVQAFKDKRVLYASEYLTDLIIKCERPYGTLNELHPNIQVSASGAPGGSLLISRDFFKFVGGYDAEYFNGYSVEDQFFHDKLSFYDIVHSLDNENLVHLYHGTSHAISKESHFDIYKAFKSLNDIEKSDLIKLKSDHLNKFL